MAATAKASPPKVSKSATCLCGAVSVTVTGVDKGAVLCHCSNCQRSSGSSFAHNYRFLDADITIDKGRDAVGSNVYLQPSTPPRMWLLHTGGMQDQTQPARELFTQNKHPWIGEVTARKPKL
ncbi:hypothetical protein LTR53_006677 [Teratosphaeriaceae sp. CCFEE 6253]|nr:hypothetical protein LTR53_006677 [Teratosphaeriaceae sp. CCFEE 6253]